MPPRLDIERCTFCGRCQDVCPGDIIYLDAGCADFVRYPAECCHCDVCRLECPDDAISMTFPWNMRQYPRRRWEDATAPGRPGARSAG